MDRYVAIKVLPQHLANDAGFRARFEREARTIARLEHRHILPVYDVAEDSGIPYLVMRYTDGGTLADLITSGGLSIDRAGALITQTAEALEYAHRQGVIHRDVKPANVLIGRDGDALLADFGIAKMYDNATQLTGEGAMIGTPAYMSPEQLRGKPVDGRTDVYSLGVVLFQALTGECPFVAETPLAIAMMHIHNPMRPPRQLNSAIPESLERIVLRATTKNPEDRFQTAGEMAAALRTALVAPTPLPVAAPERPASAAAATPPPLPAATVSLAEPPIAVAAPSPAAPPARRSNKLLIGAGIALVALAIVAVAALALRGGAPAATAPTPGGAGAATAIPTGPTGISQATAAADDILQAIETSAEQLDAGEVGAALDILKPALEAHPDDPNLLAMRAIALVANGAPDDARADIERVLSVAPDNGLIFLARGYLNQRTNKVDEAIADYTRAIELAPTLSRAYYLRSQLLSYPKKDLTGARRDLDRTIELEPDFIGARMDRAWTLYYESKLEAALLDLDHVLSLDPKHSKALYLRAQVYEGQNRAADARRDFDAAAAAAPDDKDIFRERGAFFVRQGDYASALADADRLIALDGADPQWYALRGFVLHALGRDADALAAFDKALLIGGSETWAARYGRGLALLGLDRAQEALDDLEAAQSHPDDVGGLADFFYGTSAMPSVDLARAYQALGQSDKALQALDAAIEQNSSFVAHIERGRARAAAGDAAGAREDLQEALRRAIEAKNDQQRAQVEAELAKLP
jgi:serine/threonine-protein kinase